MDLEPTLKELETAAEQLSVRVKYETLAASIGAGGLCKVHGEYRVIIDRRASTAERVATLARCLGEIDTAGAGLTDEAKAVIARYSGGAAGQ